MTFVTEAFYPVTVEEGSRDTWVAWRPDSRRLFSVRHPSRSIVVPAARGPAGMHGWWCWWSRRRRESILRGLTACCTCSPPVSTSLTPPRNKPPRGKSAEAGFLNKSANGAVTSVYWIISESHSPHVQCDLISSFSATYSKGAVHLRMKIHSTCPPCLAGEVMTW